MVPFQTLLYKVNPVVRQSLKTMVGTLTMTILELTGKITENGELEIRLPAGLPAGEVIVRIEVPESQVQESQPWTDQEIQELLIPKRLTMQQLSTWLDATPPVEAWGGINSNEDSGEFIHQRRRRHSNTLEDPGVTE